MRWLLFALSIVPLFVVARAGAQGAPPPDAPSDLRVVRSASNGGYWFRWQDNSDDEAGFRGGLAVKSGDRVIYQRWLETPEPGVSQAPAPFIDSQRVEPGCYDADAYVHALGAQGEISDEVRVPVRLCVNESSETTFPDAEPVDDRLNFPEPRPADLISFELRTAQDSFVAVWDPGSPDDRVIAQGELWDDITGEQVFAFLLAHHAADEGRASPADILDLVPAGCYNLTHTAWSIRDGVLGTSVGGVLPICIDDAGNSTLPTLANPNAPPPAPATDVRIVRDGASWYVEWRDNSNDETAFPILFSLLDEETGDVRSASAKARMNETRALLPTQKFVDYRAGCYRFQVWVFAERWDTANGIAGNVVERICVDGRELQFPSVGAGPGQGRDAGTHELLVIGTALVMAGVAIGVWSRRRRAA